jgi:guanylate kinase
MWNWLKSSKLPASKAQVPDETPAIPEQPPSTGNRIIVITGASGSGRKYTAKRLASELGIPYVLSYTTRAPRPKETEGEHYHFIAEEDFLAMVETDAFFQTIRLERGRYGIVREELDQALAQRQAAIVVANHEGSEAFHRHYGQDVIRIFIYVTKQDIRVRLEAEAAPPEVLEEYLQNYTDQVIYKKDSEYLLQNMDRESTVQKIKAFLLENRVGGGA